MSGISDSTGSSAIPSVAPKRPETSAGPAEPFVVRAGEDQLATSAQPSAPVAPSELVEKIRAMQAQKEDPTEAPRLAPAAPPQGRGGLVAPLGNLAVWALSAPRWVLGQGAALVKGGMGLVSKLTGGVVGPGFLFKRTRGLLRQGSRIVRGTHKAKEFVAEAAEAKKANHLGRFVRTEARLARVKVEARAGEVIGLARRGEVKSALRAARGAKAVEEGARLGGRWAKVAAWAGRVGRFAPVLNIPLAGLDLHDAWKTFHRPDATPRERLSAGGRAALSSVAAGLAVAGLLTPPPANLALLAASGTVGLTSTIWSALTSQTARDLASRAGAGLRGLGSRLGIGRSEATEGSA